MSRSSFFLALCTSMSLLLSLSIAPRASAESTGWAACTPPSNLLHEMEGLAVDANGTMYVGDYKDDEENPRSWVVKVSSACAVLGKWKVANHYSTAPYAIALNRKGNIDVALGTDGIKEYTPSGKLLRTWHRDAYGLTIDQKGNFYLADQQSSTVTKLARSGKVITSWGKRGSKAGEFQFGDRRPTGLATDVHGNLYVADSGNSRIQKFSPQGTRLAQWGTVGLDAGKFYLPTGIAVDSAGNIFVADTDNDRIQELSPTGRFLASWGHTGDEIDGLLNPGTIVFDTHGDLSIADTNNLRVVTLMLKTEPTAPPSSPTIAPRPPLLAPMTPEQVWRQGLIRTRSLRSQHSSGTWTPPGPSPSPVEFTGDCDLSVGSRFEFSGIDKGTKYAGQVISVSGHTWGRGRSGSGSWSKWRELGDELIALVPIFSAVCLHVDLKEGPLTPPPHLTIMGSPPTAVPGQWQLHATEAWSDGTAMADWYVDAETGYWQRHVEVWQPKKKADSDALDVSYSKFNEQVSIVAPVNHSRGA